MPEKPSPVLPVGGSRKMFLFPLVGRLFLAYPERIKPAAVRFEERRKFSGEERSRMAKNSFLPLMKDNDYLNRC
jgi:hypothetical protein